MTRTPAPRAFAVILAGGEGTRLWPWADASRPKPFMTLPGGKTLFRRTLEGVLPIVGRNGVLVVAGFRHRAWLRRQAPGLARDRILLEGTPRNTAASVALAALWVLERSPEGVMLVLPSDHDVGPDGAFRKALLRAVGAAARTGGLVTIGVKARSPDPGLGYIRPAGRPLEPGLFRVTKFVEKPGAARARRLTRSGGYFWNSGIFIWRADAILEEMRRHSPRVLEPLERWARLKRRRGPWSVPASVLRRVPSIPIDKAVLEKSTRALMLRATFRWSDLGTWDALGSILPRDRRGNGGIGRVVSIGSSDCLGISDSGVIVFVGTTGVAAVRRGDTVLVCRRDAAQRVREAARGSRGAVRSPHREAP